MNRPKRTDHGNDRARKQACFAAWIMALSTLSTGLSFAAQTQEQAQAVLLDPKAEAAARRDAVQQIMTLSTSEGIRLLCERVQSRADTLLQAVIVQALVQRDQIPPAQMQPALLTALDHAEPPLVEDIAALIGRYDDSALVARLSTVASDTGASIARRRGATLVLGHHRTQAIALVLMGLIDADTPREVRSAAFESLAELSGIIDFEEDPMLWKLWWQDQSRLDEEEWNKQITINQARRAQQITAQKMNLQDRLVELQRQVYFDADESTRAELLDAMLNDPLDVVRVSAIRLMVRRLIDRQAISQRLVEGLLHRLDDTSPPVRREAALLLRDLKDQAGADAVADRLRNESRESSPEVIKAYLLVMARLPRPGPIDRAIGLIQDRAFRVESSLALAKALDVGLVAESQKATLINRLRAIVPDNSPPEPAVIELLGRMATEEDWAKIGLWIQSEDPGVKTAAATAWSRAGRKLDALAQRAGDPVVLPILIDAAASRGNDLPIFDTLIKNKPAQEQLLLLWQRAIISVAKRLPREEILSVDDELSANESYAPLRDLVMSDVLADVLPSSDPTTRTQSSTSPAGEAIPGPIQELLLRRAELRLQRSDPALALADFKRLLRDDRFNLSILDQRRIKGGACRAALVTGDIDGAMSFANAYFAVLPPSSESTRERQAILQLFLAAAQRSIIAGQMDQAAALLKPLRKLATGTLNEAIKARLTEYESMVGNGSPTTAPSDSATTMPSKPG